MPLRSRRPAGDSGVTLVELVVAMVVAGTLLALTVSGWTRYRTALDHRSTVQEIVAALRNAQERAQSEARTYCVSFNTTAETYRVYQYSCSTGTGVTNNRPTSSAKIALGTAAFVQPDGTSNATVSFFARGSATRGSLTVVRTGSSKTYTISVEGLTGRVAYSG